MENRARRSGTISRHCATERLCRHRHAEGYVAVVLGGSYVEAGDSGRFYASAGTVIAHEPLAAHRDEFGGEGAIVLNFPEIEGVTGIGSITDPDLLARAAQCDWNEAAELIARHFVPVANRANDWPDQLADQLIQDPDTPLSEWADQMGLNPASVSRGFVRAYGVTPKRFRLEARVRDAVKGLASWQGSLAALAAHHGFADQAHLGHAVLSVMGVTPLALKAKFIQSRP
jgi:AraC-like DNA-binding protein